MKDTDKTEYVMGEVVGYSRKSTGEEGAGRSLDDQDKYNLRTCQRFDLPITPEWLYREAPARSGKLWWQGGGYAGIAGEFLNGEDTNGNTRPVLTQIVQGITSGSIKCVVVWSLDRLARHVGIMEALMELMAQHGCVLYNRNGPYDLTTPEGRQAVRNEMVAAQYVRERACVDLPRGVVEQREKGVVVGTANRLGFRAVGNKTGGIKHIEEEQNTVLEIYSLFVWACRAWPV